MLAEVGMSLAECHSHLCLPSGQFCAGTAAAAGGPRAQKPLSGEGPPPGEPRGQFGGAGSLEPGEEERRGGVKEEGGAGSFLPYASLPLTSPALSPIGQAQPHSQGPGIRSSESPGSCWGWEGWGGAGGLSLQRGPAGLGSHLLHRVPMEVDDREWEEMGGLGWTDP